MVKLGEKRVKLQLWDTAGQERFRSVTRSYYRGAAGAILVYDITNRDSFKNLARWLADARALASPYLITVLVGNKSDRDEERQVEWAEASTWAQQNDVLFLEASSLTGENVEAPFLLAARAILLAIESGSLDPEKPGSGWQSKKGNGEAKSKELDSRVEMLLNLHHHLYHCVQVAVGYSPLKPRDYAVHIWSTLCYISPWEHNPPPIPLLRRETVTEGQGALTCLPAVRIKAGGTKVRILATGNDILSYRPGLFNGPFDCGCFIASNSHTSVRRITSTHPSAHCHSGQHFVEPTASSPPMSEPELQFLPEATVMEVQPTSSSVEAPATEAEEDGEANAGLPDESSVSSTRTSASSQSSRTVDAPASPTRSSTTHSSSSTHSQSRHPSPTPSPSRSSTRNSSSSSSTRTSSRSLSVTHSVSQTPAPDDDPGPTDEPSPSITFTISANSTASANLTDLAPGLSLSTTASLNSTSSLSSSPDSNRSQPLTEVVVTSTEVVSSLTESGLPTAGAETIGSTQTGFLQNSGAVAGLFTVIGIIAASLFMCVIWFIRRRRRIRREQRWLSGVQPLPDPDDHDDRDNPFSDPHTQPNMTQREQPVTYTQQTQYDRSGNANSGHLHEVFEQFGLERSNERILPTTTRRIPPPSLAPSSPSVYAATLPADEPGDGQWPSSNPPLPMRPPRAEGPPPRPPRSHLRDVVTKTNVTFPDTPPSSIISSQSSSNPPSPTYNPKHRISGILEEIESEESQYVSKTPREILARPTLLDVRPRLARA
ncbi:hypothetical protein AX16_009619 [Volvariella volvacea WC 439]|nr:hypothetical protein AX16_009619 [Volvariella volvacea WC 439]